MSPRFAAYLFLLTASLIWGVAGPVIKYTLSYLPPFSFLFWRFLVTAVITLPFFLWYIKKHPISSKFIPRLVALGLLSTTINLSFVFLGFNKTTALQGTLITAMTPVFIAIGGVLFLRERVTRREQLGIALAIGGTIFTVVEPLLRNGFRGAIDTTLGNLFLLGYNLSWMAYVLLSKHWQQEEIRPFHITSIAFFVGAITFLPLAFFETSGKIPRFDLLPLQAILGILYMAILSGFVGYLAYQIGLRKVEAGEADVFNYLHPVWAAAPSILWLGETTSPTFFVGAILIAIGVFIAQYRPRLLRYFFLRKHIPA
ncbi:MAG: EamA family transporter [Candidatus Blackburnbacteria bacterium]|nr:EamA family transporter [Candidatus Blackburnbacteria bacterium]